MKLTLRFLNLFLALLIASWFMCAAFAADTDDEFCGQFENVGGYLPHAKDPHKVQIVKEGNLYRLVGTKSYDDYRFKKTEDGVLEDEKKGLGKIRLGDATFHGSKEHVRILKVEFCYNHFLLVRAGAW